MEDNFANWFFFSNHKDAIPVNKNTRRYAVFFSQIQTINDLLAHGMNDAYFERLFKWLESEGGYEAVTYWLLNYPIEKGAISRRAPITSSHSELLKISRSPAEVVLTNHVEDGVAGFRGGYISVLAALNRLKAAGVRNPTQRTVQIVLENMGYVEIGKAVKPYMQEDAVNRAILYGNLSTLKVEDYGYVQGYE